MAKNWYVVHRGKVPGVYSSWEECQKQVNGYRNNSYKGFKTRKEAEDYYNHEVGNDARQIIMSHRTKDFIIPVLVITLVYLCCFR